MPRYILLRETPSTNSYLSRMGQILPTGTVIYTHNQTSGRGQRGNSWESEPGKNLTFSMLVKSPGVVPSRQFVISEAVSLAIVDFLEQHVADVKIKWPNDIYCGDKKVCGILIEHVLCGNEIKHTIIGAGINVNQERFVSDAPNPVSITQLTGKKIDVEAALRDVCDRIWSGVEALKGMEPAAVDALHDRYKSLLYRGDGQPHGFIGQDGIPFNAVIADVGPTGMLKLRHEDGGIREYAFKEVGYQL